MHKTLLTIILVLSYIYLVNVQAEDTSNPQTSLGIFPAIVETVLSSDNTVENIVTITNLSNFSQPIKAVKQSFTLKEKYELTEEQRKIFDASSWIYISPEETDFILQPKESKDIHLYITQPKDATPGGHYATIYFQPLIPQELISTESIFVYARVAVMIFMQTPGDIIEHMEYKDLKFDILNNPGDFKFNLTLENLGNTHILPTGNIKVFNRLTDEYVYTGDFPSSIILPGMSKEFELNIPIPDKFGAYTIETQLNYNTESEFLSSGKKEFYIFPYTLFIFIIFPLFIIFLYVLKFGSRIRTAYRILFNKKVAEEKKIVSYPTSLFKLEPRLKFRLKKDKKKKK